MLSPFSPGRRAQQCAAAAFRASAPRPRVSPLNGQKAHTRLTFVSSPHACSAPSEERWFMFMRILPCSATYNILVFCYDVDNYDIKRCLCSFIHTPYYMIFTSYYKASLLQRKDVCSAARVIITPSFIFRKLFDISRFREPELCVSPLAAPLVRCLRVSPAR